MFEKIILKSSDSGQPISIGELAEALFFYQNVHIILDYSSLTQIVSEIGMQKLLELLTRKNVTAVYCEDTLATETQKPGMIEVHSFASFMISGDQTVGQLNNRKDRLEYILTRLGHTKKQSQALIEKFRNKVPIRKLTDSHFIEGGILSAAYQDLSDKNYTLEATKLTLLKLLGKNFPLTDYKFSLDVYHPNIYVNTNIDFVAVNNKLKQTNSTLDNITPAFFIQNLLIAKADTILAAHYGGEFYTSETSSEIIQLRHYELLKKIGIDKRELNTFKEITIPDCPSMRDVVNNKERSFDDFLEFLDKSDKFRNWVHGVNPDEKIASAYLKELTSQTWINNNYTKTIRYILSTAVGALEPISGAAYSAADTFLAEKLCGGWQPSHFINQKLKPFLSTEAN